MLIRITLASFLLLPVVPPHLSSLPWNDSGHRIISYLTWSELSPQVRAAVTALLEQHPRYRADLLDGLPEGADAEATARFAFGSAANWPDTVRSTRNPLHRTGNHPSWHYINIPYLIGEMKAPEPEAEKGDGPQDVVQALPRCIADLRDDKLPAADRAIALCWVLHLVEDIHQPLHACTMYSTQFPKGDRGGNSFLVTRYVFDPNSQINLHALWDSMLGSYKATTLDECVADGLGSRADLSRVELAKQVAIHDPAAWAQESHELAVHEVYLDGKLSGATTGSGDGAKPPLLPNEYLARAEQVAMLRGALAAHRLADVLADLFAAK